MVRELLKMRFFFGIGSSTDPEKIKSRLKNLACYE